MQRKLSWAFVLSIGTLLALFHASVGAQQSAGSDPEHRIALVIGNSAYQQDRLRNPVNDATDIAQSLKQFGFKVILRTDANQRQMKRSLREFRGELRRGGVGLFYYAGHGVQHRGRNYLVPIGADIEAESDIEDESVDGNLILSYMEEAGTRVNIVILDACRNNPFARGFRSANRGLVVMETVAKGTFIAYATAPGSVAHDGDGRNGLYTKHLLTSLKHPDSDIERVFKRVRSSVAEETKNNQIPWDSSSLLGDFRFKPATASATTTGTDPKQGQQNIFFAPRF